MMKDGKPNKAGDPDRRLPACKAFRGPYSVSNSEETET